jgi:hypothetical protein
VPATCNLIHTWTFSPTSQWQGTYTFSDLSGLTADKATDPTVLHVTGLGDVAAGFGIYAARCTSLRGFTGVTFTLKGTVISVGTPNTLTFVVQTNEDEPIDTVAMRGQCAGSAGVNCLSPRRVITTSDQPQTVMFSELTGGKPVATLDVDAVIGLQWLVDTESSALDLSLSDVTLIGPGPMGDCSMSGASGGGGVSSGG